MQDVRLNQETCWKEPKVRLWCGSRSAVCSIPGGETLINTSLTHQDNSTVLTEVWRGGASGPWVGLTLALMSAVLIAGSVILKKKALLRLSQTGQTRAGLGGHGYLKDWLWWGGLLTMGTGEACNFAAYLFSPATMVTPLGALSVLISAVMSSYLLGELLNPIQKIGCLLCVLGSILLVIHAPQEQEVTSLQEMTSMLLEPGFLVFSSSVLLLCFLLILYFSPRVGQKNILVYIGICSLLGAFTVTSVKGLAIVIHQGFSTVFHDVSVLTHPLTWILLFTLIISTITQVNYLNKSLDSFNTVVVYPIYYVLFTSVVLATSVILFQEWSSIPSVNVVALLGAFLVIVVGVALLHLFKELQVTMEQLSDQLCQPTEEAPANERREEGKRTQRKEDKQGLMNNMVSENFLHVREEGPRVFIIS